MRSRFLLIAALAVAFPARAQTGQLDASFGDRGIVLGPILNSTATGVAVDAHHNIIVAGTVLFPTPTQQAGTYLARYTPEGTLDPTFGDGGIVFNPSVDAEVESGRVVVLPDQSYFTTERRRAEGAAYHTVYATRVQPDGVRTCYVGVTNGAVVNGMAVTPQGEVVLMEGSPSSTWSILSVLQVDVNYTTGACRLDPEFGNMGGASFFFPTGVYGLGHDVAIQPDGRILIAGLVQPTPGEIRDAEPVVARLMPRGTMDFSFGSNHRGYVMHKPRGVQQAIATDIALSPDGTIVVSGFGERDSVDVWMAMRFRPDGVPDTTFGTDGALTLQPVDGVPSRALDVAVDPLGRVLLAGAAGDAWGVARLQQADGVLDAAFGAGGLTITRPHELPGTLAAITLQPDGNLLVAGDVKKDEGDIAAVARYHNAQTNTATEQAPIAASALRVWPSPAHHAATLAADLRSAGLVHADLYDVLGRHVAALADEVHAAGPLQLALDLGGVAPGVYVVRLETPDGIATQRLVVR